MADSPNGHQWADLRRALPPGDDTLATMPVSVDGRDTDMGMAVDAQGRLHLLIPVAAEGSNEHPPDLTGLRVRKRHLESGHVLDLSAPPSHEPVFSPFCREVVRAVSVEGRNPTRAVATIMRAWQSAWKPVRPMMDKTAQVGLFGELLVLRSLMIPCIGTTAVEQWSGPDSERHDFAGERVHVEVKTTRKSRAEHEISRVDQLHVPAGRRLLFVSVQVEESIDGAESLATQVDAVVESLRSDPASMDDFLAKLGTVGWSEELRPSKDLLRFNVRAADIYEVDSHFPRIPETFAQPPGVVALRYTIDLANLPWLSVDEARAIVAGEETPR